MSILFFFGTPIIDAYVLGESQKWYGVSIHDSTMPTDQERSKLSKIPKGKEKEWIPLTTTCSVPIKEKKKAKEISVINWPMI